MSDARKLPKPKRLIVETEKVTGYLLNPDHPIGKAKAKFFKNRGFTTQEVSQFVESLKQHGQTQSVTATETTAHGEKFTVQCQIQTPDGKNPCILTAWIVEGDKPPRLVTAHPNT
jgi:hypothetical protein